MTAGIVVKNLATGSITADTVYKNQSLRLKQTYTTTGDNVIGSFVDVTYVGTNPSVAWICSQFCTIVYATLSGSTWTFRMYSAGPVGTSFTLFVFDEPVTAPTFGFKLRNPTTGQLTFTSAEYPMKVVGEYDITVAAIAGTAQTINLDPAKTYAVGHALLGKLLFKLGTGVGLLTNNLSGGRSISGGIETGSIRFQSTASSAPSNFMSPGRVQAVDVTGY